MAKIVSFGESGYIINITGKTRFVVALMTENEFVWFLMQTARSVICQIEGMRKDLPDFMGWVFPTTIRGIESQVSYLYESIPVLADHRSPSLLGPFEITTIKDALRNYQGYKRILKRKHPEFAEAFKRINWTNRDRMFYE